MVLGCTINQPMASCSTLLLFVEINVPISTERVLHFAYQWLFTFDGDL